MKGFEQAFELLKGYQFEDRESELNTLWLHRWVGMSRRVTGSFRCPMVVITGTQKSEIDRLISSALRNVLFGGVLHVDNIDGDDLDFAARQAAAVILHKNCQRLASAHLARFITAESWKARPSRTSKIRGTGGIFNLSTVVIVTGPPDLEISTDLLRRSVFIRLK